jgi:8-oxo-dGTP diphosphatase
VYQKSISLSIFTYYVYVSFIIQSGYPSRIITICLSFLFFIRNWTEIAYSQVDNTFFTMVYHYFKHIASVVARRNENLLLVQQQAPTDIRPNWGLPGGQVEPGEELLAGHQRELFEETGLYLVGTPTIAFVIQVLRETEEGIQESLACHFACEVAGQIDPHDPDGLVLSAHWIEECAALEHLGALSWHNCEPLRRWLCGEAVPGTVYTAK